MVCVKSSEDVRASFQNGFWPIKLVIFVGLLIGALYIPAGIFDTIWMWFGLIGGSVFMPMQLVLLLDLISSWTEGFLGNYVETKTRSRTTRSIRYTRYYYISLIIMYLVFAMAGFEIIHNAFYKGKNSPRLVDLVNVLVSTGIFVALCTWNSILVFAYSVNKDTPLIPFGEFKSALINLYACFWGWSLSCNDSNESIYKVGMLLP